MKVAIIYNKDMSRVINTFGIQNKETYSPKTVKKVANALENGGHNVEIIDGNMHVIDNLQDFMPRVMRGERTGMVFNMAYGIQGESRYTHIPSMLEMLGIPYVGSNPSGHALALDKVITKIIMQKHGIPTPEFWTFTGSDQDLSDVKYPVIVKPVMEAVSYGLKVVYNEEELKGAIEYVREEFGQNVLVERFIRGREFCIGLLGNDPIETFPVLEIDLENDPEAIQTIDDKKGKPREKICPANISEDLGQKMEDLSIRAFNALGLRDFARVDIRVDENFNIHILEINSMASLGETGSYVKAASVAGYPFNELVNKMLDVALIRYFADEKMVERSPSSRTKKIPVHVRLRGYLRSRREQNEDLLKKMVNINSHVRNIDGVNSLSSLIAKNLVPMGFSHQVIPQVETGNIHFFTNVEKDYDILLLSNLDNSTGIRDHEYYHGSEQRLFGTGIWEHKGGILVMISALKALRFTRKLKKIRIGILLTTDDNLKNRGSREIIREKSDRARYVLGIHGAHTNGGIITSRSGAAVFHIQMNLRKKDDPNDVMKATRSFSRMLNRCIGMSDVDKGLLISPKRSLIESDLSECHAYGEASLSVRFEDMELLKPTGRKIKDSVPKKDLDIVDFQLEEDQYRPPMKRTDRVDHIWKRIEPIANSLDLRLREERRWSSADICFVQGEKFVLDGFGPMGDRSPKQKEYILRHSLLERGALLAMTLIEFSRGE